MRNVWTVIFGVAIFSINASAADAERNAYARIAVLRPHDGDTVDFEAGYIRPHASLATTIAASDEQALPQKVHDLIAKTTVEILTLRPTMSYGLILERP